MKVFKSLKRIPPINLFRLIYYFPHFLKLYWRLFCDKRIPFYLKLMLLGALVYFISPVDIIPEIINPLLGFADDIVVVALALKYFIKWAPQDVVAEHVSRLENEK